MTVEIDIEVNTGLLLRNLNDLALKQVPFAAAKTLTLLAKQAADTKRAQLPGIFKLRNKRVQKGFTIIPAKKGDWPLAEAQVGSRDGFMVLHETGGAKRAKKGQNVAIPMKPVRRTSAGAIRKAQKPTSILAKKTGSIVDASPGRVIRRKTTKRSPLGMFWLLRSKARIKPVLGLQKTTERIVKKEHAKLFGQELGKAIATAK